MTNDSLWSYLKKNQKEIKQIGVNLKFKDIYWGDMYENGNGEEVTFDLFGDEYNVGYEYIVEDREDWGQAESYQVSWCRKNGKQFESESVHNMFINFKEVSRNKKINDILKK